MQSASPEPISRFRALIPPGTIIAALLVLLLTITIGDSTVTASWVSQSGVITMIAVIAAAAMGVLALIRRVPAPAALAAGVLAAPVAAYLGARGALAAAHTGDPTQPLQLIGVWMGRIGSGSAFTDQAFVLLLLGALFWISGGWLSWCVLRWQQPLPGLIPGASVLATNVLNFPQDQNGYVLAFVLLLCVLLLWSTYRRSIDGALRMAIRLGGDVRWDFWEAGVVVTIVLILLGIFLPPLSSTDRTVDLQSGMFRSWADLQERLNHQMPFGQGSSFGNSIGFTLDARLSGPLQRTPTPVFTYTVKGSFPGPYYFRGVDLTQTVNGEWRFDDRGPQMGVAGNSQVPWLEHYSDMQQGTIHVQMLKPPAAGSDIYFYPGMLSRINRPASILTRYPPVQSVALPSVALPTARPRQSPAPSPRIIRPSPDGVTTLDRLDGLQGSGAYDATVLGSNATEDQLRQAGTDYPAWVQPYRNFLYSSPAQPAANQGSVPYRPLAVLARIHQLALQVTAGTTNPYDAAVAIETYLRSNYKYTLKPPQTPAGQDPLAFFLFDSKQGYCEYFASAMGDMLRSLGIPVRLVSGYGPGTFDDKLNRYVVRESDAHIWPEIYAPGFGWIAFEPTADGVYTPVTRGSVSGACRGGAENCGSSSQGGPGAGSLPQINRDPGAVASGGSTGARAAQTQPFHWELALLGIALVLMAMGLVASRWLRPGTVGGAWRRTGVLARLAGVGARPGETPIEFGERLAVELPEAAAPARELASHFTVAAYAPVELVGGVRDAALSAWRELRPHLLRGIPRHLRHRR